MGSFSAEDFGDGPLGVFGDEGVGVLRRSAKGWQVVMIAGISQRDTHVAQEARALGPLDGGLAEEGAELLIGEGKKVAQAVVEDGLAGVQAGLLRDFRKAVPRANCQAVVAAIDAVAHQRA